MTFDETVNCIIDLFQVMNKGLDGDCLVSLTQLTTFFRVDDLTLVEGDHVYNIINRKHHQLSV